MKEEGKTGVKRQEEVRTRAVRYRGNQSRRAINQAINLETVGKKIKKEQRNSRVANEYLQRQLLRTHRAAKLHNGSV